MSFGFTPCPTHDRCVDYAVKIRVNPDQKGIDLNVKHSMVSSVHIHAHRTSHFYTEPIRRNWSVIKIRKYFTS